MELAIKEKGIIELKKKKYFKYLSLNGGGGWGGGSRKSVVLNVFVLD